MFKKLKEQLLNLSEKIEGLADQNENLHEQLGKAGSMEESLKSVLEKLHMQNNQLKREKKNFTTEENYGKIGVLVRQIQERIVVVRKTRDYHKSLVFKEHFDALEAKFTSLISLLTGCSRKQEILDHGSGEVHSGYAECSKKCDRKTLLGSSPGAKRQMLLKPTISFQMKKRGASLECQR